MIGPLLFFWTNLALTLFAFRTARRIAGLCPAERAVVGLLWFAAAIQLGPLVLGSLGALRAWPLAALATVLAGLERLAPERRVRSEGAPAPRSLWLATAVGAIGGWWLVSAGASPIDLVWDDFTYHAAVPAWWVSRGALEVPSLTFQAYYPLGSELSAAWFMVSLGHDAHANLVLLLWIALALAAWVSLSQQLRQPPFLAALAMSCFAASTHVIEASRRFTAVDLAATAFCLAALSLSGAPTPEGWRARALPAGIAAGLAVGCRVTAASTAGVLLAFWALRSWRTRSWHPVARFALPALACGGYWYARNLWVAGNPLFPAEIGPFPGPFDAETRYLTTLLPAVAANWRDPGFWLDLARRRLDWPLPLGILAAFGVGAGAAAALRGAPGRERELRGLLTASAVIWVALFPFQPFSGTFNAPDLGAHHYPRYLTLPFALGLLLLPEAARHPAARRTVGAAAILTLALALAPPAPRHGLGMLAGIGVALALTAPGWPRRLPVVAASAFWAILSLATPYKAEAAAARLFGPRQGVPLGEAWAALEDLPVGSRIAVLSRSPGSHAFYYPLFGRRLQHRPVRVYPDGTLHPPLHETWRGDPPAWFWEFDRLDDAPEPRALLANLRSAGVQFALVTQWPTGLRSPPSWPPARAALLAVLPVEQRRFANGYAEIWDVR